MKIEVQISQNFDIHKISDKLIYLGQAALFEFAKAYKELTIKDIKEKKLFQPRTGNLLKSIQTTPQGKFGVNITVNLEYGYFLEYGTSSYIIRPNKKRALKIPSENGFIFVKKAKHPGIQPTGWFIGKAEDRIPSAESQMKTYFLQGLKAIQRGEI